MKAYIKHNKNILFSLFIIFTISLIYNTLTPFTTDDFTYLYSFKTNERITSIFQLFPSMASHYQEINGRTIPHFLVQLMLIFPKGFFNIINAGIYTAFVFLITKLCSNGKKFHIGLFFALSVCFWVNTPVYGQVFLWTTGAINYYWGYFFGLLFMMYYIRIYRTEQPLSKKAYILLCILGFLFGAYNENASFSIIFVSFLLLVSIAMKWKNFRLFIKYTIPVFLGALGYFTILLSPASSAKVTNFALSSIYHNFIDIMTSYYDRHRTLLIILGILFVIAKHYKVAKKELILSLSFLFISIISAAMLCVASYLADRNLSIGAVFLVIAIFQLLHAIRENIHTECVAYCFAAYFIINSILCLWDGTFDIYNVYRQNEARETYIEEQIANGNTVVTVPIIYPATMYSCKYVLTDLTTEEQEYNWPNGHIAKYYGLERIYGSNPQ